MTLSAPQPGAAPAAQLRAGVRARHAIRAGLLAPAPPRGPSLMVVLFLLCVLMPFQISVGTIVLSPIRAYSMVAVPLIVAMLLTGRFGRVLVADGLLLAHWVWAQFTLLYLHGAAGVEFGVSYGLDLMSGYFVARAFVRTTDQFLATARLLVFAVIFTVPFAVIEAMGRGQPLLEMFRTLPGIDVIRTQPDERLGLIRAQVIFRHSIHYGLFCALGVAFAIGLAVRAGGLLWRAMRFGAVSLGVVLSLSSGAALMSSIQLAILAYERLFRSWRARWTVLLVILTLAFVVAELGSDRTVVMILATSIAFNSHNAYWRRTIFEWGSKSVGEHPLFGIGLSDWERPIFMPSASVDNFWLLTAMRHGLPALLLLAAVFVLLTWAAGRVRVAPGSPAAAVRVTWLATIIGLGVAMGTVHLWGPIQTLAMFVLGSGAYLISAPRALLQADAPETVEDPVATAPPAAPPAGRHSRSPGISQAPPPEPSPEAAGASAGATGGLRRLRSGAGRPRQPGLPLSGGAGPHR